MENIKDNYSREGMHEGNPGNINPDDRSYREPAKTIRQKIGLEIKESGFGRDQGQTPADEHIETFGQIEGHGTNFDSDDMEQTMVKEFDTDDFRRVDERDNGDSSEDWDAEKSRTGRHK
jgi:hypothetical protein